LDKTGKEGLKMKKVNVEKIATEILSTQTETNQEEIAKLVDEKFNGKSLDFNNMGSEIMMMVAELNGLIIKQQFKLVTKIIQKVVDDLQD